jgi:hypothetical protein
VVDLVELDQRRVVVPVFSTSSGTTVSVDGLLGQLQRVVATTRESHPDLGEYRLYDVSLCVDQGELKAVLDFRR